jgi:hypothetical protein
MHQIYVGIRHFSTIRSRCGSKCVGDYIFVVPRGVLKKLGYFGSRGFFKLITAKGGSIAWQKIRGLGIHDLDIKNTTLLSKWHFKLLIIDETWQE